MLSSKVSCGPSFDKAHFTCNGACHRGESVVQWKTASNVIYIYEYLKLRDSSAANTLALQAAHLGLIPIIPCGSLSKTRHDS